VRRGTQKKQIKHEPVVRNTIDSSHYIPIDRLTIQLRAFVERKRRKRNRPPPKTLAPSDWTLIFDTETTTDPSQRLRFGTYQLRRQGYLQERGVFYEPEALTGANIATICSVIDKERAQAVDERIFIMTRAEFVQNVFLDKAYALGAVIVGFNLPFDLSRLAIDHRSARGRMKGGFSFVLAQRDDRLRLRVKHISGRSAFIDFAATKGEDPKEEENKGKTIRIIERGYFVDLKTLSASLTSESHDLKSLSEALKVQTPKVDSDEHGRELTEEYVRYGIRDTQTTWECFDSLAERYNSYELADVGLQELYSEASLGKAYLKAMNVRPWREVQPDAPSKLIGHIMSAYFGGRAEVHLRRQITQVLHCDFMSMYPTVCTLMGLWRFVISQGVSPRDDTEAVRQFIKAVKPGDLRRPSTWKTLNVLVQVFPDDDVFPVRARYPVPGPFDNDDTATIGLNRLSGKEPLWFTLADCIISKILTGKTPRVVRAIRFDPKDIQPDLKSISIAGNQDYRIDPTVDDFYKRLIELRQDVKSTLAQASANEQRSLDSDQLAIKILANATSYGIFVELNVEDLDKPERMICHGWRDKP
jgi:hypothetical protein